MNNIVNSVLLVGVGGQGILLASNILARAALLATVFCYGLPLSLTVTLACGLARAANRKKLPATRQWLNGTAIKALIRTTLFLFMLVLQGYLLAYWVQDQLLPVDLAVVGDSAPPPPTTARFRRSVRSRYRHGDHAIRRPGDTESGKNDSRSSLRGVCMLGRTDRRWIWRCHRSAGTFVSPRSSRRYR